MNENVRDIKTDEYTIKSGHLDVGDGHRIWYEQWGNKKAKTPILFFHGGPGAGFKPKHKYRFDPKRHQVIGFDQRGAGNSLPHGKLEHNTTDDLINDTVKLLDELGVKKVYVYGGSWGSALALLFSIKHQSRVQSTIVNGVFTASQAEIDWIDKGAFRNFYPEVWERFQNSVAKNFRDDPTGYHYKVLTVDISKSAIIKSAKALADLEGPPLKFDWRGFEDIEPDKDPKAKEEEYDYVPYRIYAHYVGNGCFVEDEFILRNAHKIKTPLAIVQGRYDMVCPPTTAYKIHQAVSQSKLYITLSSHSFDPENRTGLATLVDTLFV